MDLFQKCLNIDNLHLQARLFKTKRHSNSIAISAVHDDQDCQKMSAVEACAAVMGQLHSLHLLAAAPTTSNNL